MATLGESMIRKILRRYSIGDEQGEVIEYDSLVDLISLFKYNCLYADRNELKFYLFNQGVIEQSMRQHNLRKDKLYIDCEVLMVKLRDCREKLGFSKSLHDGHETVASTYEDIANHIIQTKVASVS